MEKAAPTRDLRARPPRGTAFRSLRLEDSLLREGGSNSSGGLRDDRKTCFTQVCKVMVLIEQFSGLAGLVFNSTKPQGTCILLKSVASALIDGWLTIHCFQKGQLGLEPKNN